MDRLCKILSALLLVCSNISGQIILPGPVMRTISAGGSASCPADGSPADVEVPQSGDDETQFGLNADRIYWGLGAWTATATKEICKVGFYVGVGAGTITGKKYRAAVWNNSSGNLGTQVGGFSDEVSGWSADGWVYFQFNGTKPSITSGTVYHITVATYDAGTTTLSAADGANRPKGFSDSPTSITGNTRAWNSTGGNDTDLTTFDPCIRVYWFD